MAVLDRYAFKDYPNKSLIKHLEKTRYMTKILVSGLGGGLDVLNASLLYFASKDSDLGTVRKSQIESISDCCRFSENGAWITGKSYRRGRFIENMVAEHLGCRLAYFSRNHDGKPDPARLREALISLGHEHRIFVDGGGDSLILREEDACEGSETSDPFKGGDAETLEALSGLENCYLAAVSVGLDIDRARFMSNLELLDRKGAYLGKVNPVTGEREDYRLNGIIDFDEVSLARYFGLIENVLVLNEEDLLDPGKMISHTAAVTYHAMRGNSGIRRTYTPWEPETDGKRGVLVEPEHQWIYFFDAGKIHEIKKKVNITAS